MKSSTTTAFCTLGIQPQSPLQKSTSQFGKSFSLVLMFVLMCLGAQAQPLFTNTATTIPNPLASFNTGINGRSAPVFVDIDNDGDFDCFSGASDGSIRYYRNNGTATAPSFAPIPSPFSGSYGVNSKIAFADLDNDGLQDATIGNQMGVLTYFKNDGGLTFTQQFGPYDTDTGLGDPFDGFLFNPGGAAPVFMDFDDDNDLDCFVGTSSSSNSIVLLRNEGTEEDPNFFYVTGNWDGCGPFLDLDGNPFSNVSVGSSNAALPNGVLTFADINFDGDLDGIVGQANGFFRYFNNTGCTYFDVTGYIPSSTNPINIIRNNFPSGSVTRDAGDFATPAFVDIDNDGDLDWFYGNQAGVFTFYENRSCRTEPVFRDAIMAPVNCATTHIPVTLAATANPSVTIVLADFGLSSVVSGCTSAPLVPVFSPATITCANANSTIPVSMTVTDPGNGESRSCTVNIQVIDNTLPSLTHMMPAVLPATLPVCHGTSNIYNVYLDATGNATMGTVIPTTVPNQFTDNCSFALSVTNQPPSVFTFNCSNISSGPSPYQIVLRATDPTGNFNECTSTIMVRDTVKPVVTTPLSLVNLVGCNISMMTPVTYAPSTPTATDACSIVTTNQPTVSGTGTVSMSAPYTFTFSAAGTYTITWSFTDGNMNTRTVNQQVNVTTTPLQWAFTGAQLMACNTTGTATVSAPADASQCYATVVLDAPLANDCGVSSGTITYGDNSPLNDRYSVGTNTVVYTATKGVNTINCIINVVVSDTQVPSLMSWATPASPITAPSSGGFGSMTTATYNTGNSACNLTISWNPPASSNVTDNCTSSPTRRLRYTYTAPGAMPSMTMLAGPIPQPMAPGTYVLTYDYVDAAGNASLSTYSFTISVVDNIDPVITCPSPIVVNTGPDRCDADVLLLKPGGSFISDNCTLPIGAVTGPFFGTAPMLRSNSATTGLMQIGSTSNYTFPIGVSTVHFWVADASGNDTPCDLSITVKDNQKPVLTSCPSSPQVINSTTCTGDYTWAHPSITDNCPTGLVSEVKITGKTTMPYGALPSGPTMTFNEGASVVTYRARDGASPANMDSCSFTVNVYNNIPPSFTTCPAAQGSIAVVNTDPGVCYYTLRDTSFATRLGTVGGGMGCDPGTMTFHNLSTNQPVTLGTQLTPGNYILRATLRDFSSSVNNMQSTCQFQVTIRDNQAPTLVAGTCPSTAITANMTAGQCTALATFNAPQFTDNCAPTSPLVTVTYSNSSVSPVVSNAPYTANTPLPKGGNVITYIARDANNNQAACVFVVNVVDNQVPTFSNCPTVVQFVNVMPSCSTSYTSPVITALDNCSATVSPSTAQTTPVILGTNSTMSFTATDGTNSTTCVITITPRDATGPVITGCPSNQAVAIGSSASVCTASLPAAWTTPTATDACSPTAVLVSGPTVTNASNTPVIVVGNNAQFPAGVHTVTYVFRDNATIPNQSTCAFTVTVTENVPPTVQTCPNITVSTDPNTCSRTITQTYLQGLPSNQKPSATDVCSPSISYVPVLSAPSIIVQANITLNYLDVTWNITDGSNNTSNCVQRVTVMDQQLPTLTCNPYTVQVDIPGNNFISSSVLAFNPKSQISVSDNCAPLTTTSVTANPALLAQYPVGVSYINWQVSDGLNTQVCQQTITVTSGTPSACAVTLSSCPPAVSGTAGVAINLGALPTASTTGSCSGTTTVSRTLNGNPITQNHTFPTAGTYTVVYVGTNGSASSAPCNQTVTVTSGSCVVNQAPSIVGPNINQSITVPADANQCYASRANITFGVTASDNCGALMVTNDAPAQLSVANSPIMVNFTATNSFGSAMYQLLVTVTPNAEICGDGIDNDCDGDIDEGSANSGIMEALMTTDGAARDSAGFSVAIAGGIAVVGAPRSDAPGLNSGKAYVFEFDGTSWAQVAIIDPTDNLAGDLFGYSVATDGQNIVIGSPKHASKGAAYFYEYTGVLTFKNKTMGTFNGDDYGASVSVDGNYAVVGAPYFDHSAVSASGAAYVLNLSGVTWVPLQTLTSNAGFGKVNGRFGHSVSIENNSIAVGALNESVGAITFAGAVYTFYKSGATWTTPGLRLTQGAPVQYAYLGASVAIDGDLLVAGAYNDRFGVATGNRTGGAYLYKRTTANTNTFTQVSRLTSSDGALSDNFGWSVAIDGNEVLVGARFGGDFIGSDAGSAYHYTIPGSGISSAMTEDNQMVDVDFGASSDQFGFAVDIDAGTQIFGAPRHDEGGNIDRGVAYILANDCGNNRPAVSRNDRQDIEVAQAVRCFPNPSEDLVNIDITMDEANEVHIMVMDATGRLVSDIFHGTVEGVTRYYFDGSSVNSGMYYIRVESPAFFQIVPVAIVK